ncbi:hypothetical protein MMC10_002339 [Thelotrema lepadinum]|nr:hypothetical protein [Thelotrema lepadinum]
MQKPPSALELDNLTFGTRYNGPDSSDTYTPYGAQTPKTPNELESNPPTPTRARSTSRRAPAAVVQSLKSPPGNLHRFLNSCLISLVLGLNDSAPGALLPYIESYYSITYGTVSLLFVANAIGFILAAPFTSWLQTKLGRAGIILLSQALVVGGYVLVVSRLPFALIAVNFFLSGLGSAWTLSVNNVFIASMTNGTALLGVFHGCYGVGGILGPLLATALVSSGRNWSDFYFVTLSLAIFNGICAFWTSRGYEKELSESADLPLTSPSYDTAPQPSRLRALLKALHNRTTLLGAAFIFAYQGAEVSISGWILSFLLTTRPHPDSQSPSLGYVTSGFWGGITLGRFVLSHLAHRMGERVAVIVLVVGATLLQLVVWFVPDIIGEAVAIALVGLLLGPIYAFAVSTYSRLLDRDQLVSALSFVSAMGSSGGAVAPFVTGIVSQKVGTWVVNPVAIGLFAVMVGVWVFLPRVEKRRE